MGIVTYNTLKKYFISINNKKKVRIFFGMKVLLLFDNLIIRGINNSNKIGGINTLFIFNVLFMLKREEKKEI